MSPLPFWVVDAFTDDPFSGNPAAVVLFEPLNTRASDSNFLLKLSQEFNYQETAFLVPLPSPNEPTFSLRWFTPEVEYPMCGHATLGASHVLFTTHFPNAALLCFETLSGPLWARRIVEEAGMSIELDFPAQSLAPTQQAIDQGQEQELMSAVVAACGEFDGKVVGWAKADLGWIIELDSGVDLAGANINVAPFSSLGDCVYFTQAAPSDALEDIRSRVLDPVEKIQEDPVTGSAHCALTPYWLQDRGTSEGSTDPPLKASPHIRLQKPLSAHDTLLAKQVSKRGGDLRVVWEREAGRVKLVGKAVTVMQGTLLL